MGRSMATIGKYAKAQGLSFDRTRMDKAIKASQTDRKQRRGVVADQWLQIIEEQTARVAGVGRDGKLFETLVPVAPGIQDTRSLAHVPPSDLRLMAQAVSTLSTAMVNLEKVDQDGGMADTRSMVGSLLMLLRASVDGEERMNPIGEVAA